MSWVTNKEWVVSCWLAGESFLGGLSPFPASIRFCEVERGGGHVGVIGLVLLGFVGVLVPSV